ncbi:hypothetical protein ACQKCH_11205 [Nubsella zeaxanthinifaciens]|uniref:hypothetical protein n=1 Tax=Nubsella zeaxanthinifaciens TaxID=392412 RepID=UPI003D014120
MVPGTIFATVASFAGGNLASYFFNKALDNYFDTETKLADELRQVIDDTITEYQDKYPQNSGRLLPFYHSPELITAFLRFRVMQQGEYPLNEVIQIIENEKSVLAPTGEELEKFYDIFLGFINANEELRKLEIKETFQEEVFTISRKVSSLHAKVEELAKVYNGDLEAQWKDRLDAYMRKLKEFKPTTALTLLEQLETSIANSQTKPSQSFMAFLTYGKGICLGLSNKNKEAYTTYIKAYNLDQTNPTFTQRAAISYHQLEDLDEAGKMSQHLIDQDRYSVVGWAIWLLLKPRENFTEHLASVPKLVREDLTFMRHLDQLSDSYDSEYYNLLLNNGLIPNCTDYPDFEITIDNYKEALYWVNVCLREIFSFFYFDFNNVNQSHQKQLFSLNQVVSAVLKVTEGTEVTVEKELLDFLLALTNFYLTENGDYALEMESCYRKLRQRDHTYGLHCLNSLQLSGHMDRAIAFFEEFDFSTSEYLLAKLYCYDKAGHNEKYIATVKNFVASITELKNHFLTMYLNIMVELKLTNRLSEFKLGDFLQEKTFINSNDEIVVRNIGEILFNGATEGNIRELMQVIDESGDKQLINLIGSAFFAVNEDAYAIQALGKHLDTTDPHRELYQYINALYRSKQSHAELLVLLKQWRLEHAFNRQLLYFEAELRRNLLEWDEIVQICEYYLSVYPNDEVILTLYIHALNELNTEVSKQKIISSAEKLQDFEFYNIKGIINIANILFSHQKELEAFELLYRYAVDPKEVQLRMAYFNLCLRNSSTNLPMGVAVAYETAEEGRWIKYEFNGEKRFLELNEEAKRHPNYKEFFGKKVGETITFKRAFGNLTDTVKINRIMNKFLCLHDQIMEQAASDPLSGLPLYSFQIDPENPSSFFDLLKSFAGDDHKIELNERANDINQYYEGNLALSILAYKYHKDSLREAYYTLATEEKGILSIPLAAYVTPINNRDKFVIDYSSLLFFFQLSHVHQAKFHHKFIISRYIYEYLKATLRSIEQGVDAPYAAGIMQNGEVELEDLTNFNRGQLNHLRGLIGFIEENCEVRLSDRTIDFIRNANLEVGKRHTLDVAMSTALLVEDIDDSILITDDRMYLHFNLLPLIHQSSSEHYVKQFFGLDSPLLKEFAKNRFINYSPELWQLKEEFYKYIGGLDSRYMWCLENLNIRNGTKNLDKGLSLVKDIVLNPLLTEQQMEMYVTEILTNLVRGGDRKVLLLTQYHIEAEFKLLGNKLDLVRQCLLDAMDILSNDL